MRAHQKINGLQRKVVSHFLYVDPCSLNVADLGQTTGLVVSAPNETLLIAVLTVL